MQDQAIQMELRTKGFLGAISEGTEEVGLPCLEQRSALTKTEEGKGYSKPCRVDGGWLWDST